MVISASLETSAEQFQGNRVAVELGDFAMAFRLELRGDLQSDH
jgi:hypothetical protein